MNECEAATRDTTIFMTFPSFSLSLCGNISPALARLMCLATVALVMGIVVMVMSGREEDKAEQNRDTHTEARSRIREITNLITSKFQSFINKPVTDSAR